MIVKRRDIHMADLIPAVPTIVDLLVFFIRRLSIRWSNHSYICKPLQSERNFHLRKSTQSKKLSVSLFTSTSTQFIICYY